MLKHGQKDRSYIKRYLSWKLVQRHVDSFVKTELNPLERSRLLTSLVVLIIGKKTSFYVFFDVIEILL